MRRLPVFLVIALAAASAWAQTLESASRPQPICTLAAAADDAACGDLVHARPQDD